MQPKEGASKTKYIRTPLRRTQRTQRTQLPLTLPLSTLPPEQHTQRTQRTSGWAAEGGQEQSQGKYIAYVVHGVRHTS